MRGAELVDADGSPDSTAATPRETSPERLGRADLVVIAGLIVFPTLLYMLPALFGRPFLPGDDLYQNYPLRVVAGQLLGGGHLPLWNSWIWSGTPLLGGFNAGALYPGTLLFALLGPLAAWVVNEIAVFAVCGVGLYLLFRNHRLVPLAAAIGAVSFTFAGSMQAHLVHIGLIQGMSWAPWILLAMDHLAARSRHQLAWWSVLGTATALVILSGEPRAMANVSVIVLVYGAVLVWRSASRMRMFLVIASAVPFALALGAVQLLPGLDFLGVSQRSHAGYSWYAVGSLLPSQLALSVVPYLIGGYTDLRLLPAFAGSGSNLDEITGYIGLIALVALVTFPFWMRAKYDRLWAWVAMIAVGLLLALGGNTPLGRLLAHVPLYGHQRLQSRNLLIVDLGLAGLVACWVDAVIAPARARPRRGRRLLEDALALTPTIMVIVLVVIAACWGRALQEFLNVSSPRPQLFMQLRGYLIAAVVLAAAVGVFAVTYRLLQPRPRAVLLVVLVVADLGLALVNQELGPVDSSVVSASGSDTAALLSRLQHGGRFAVYDPEQRVRTSENALALALRPDLPMLRELPSVQGYSSAVDATYAAETGTHTIRVVSLKTLSGPEADDLDLALLLVPASYVDPPTTPDARTAPPVVPALQAALVGPRWRRSGTVGDFLAFTNTQARGRAWLRPLPASSIATVSGTVSVRHVGSQDEETDLVRTNRAARLVRSVAYGDGWRAELRTADGSVRSLPARRLGLVQSVAVPAGVTTVTWTYHPPGVRAGLILTLFAIGLIVAIGVFLGVRRRVRDAGRPSTSRDPLVESRTSSSLRCTAPR